VCAGLIIPTVFAGGYKMFPKALHGRAVLLGGAVAMLEPSVGPLLGGYVAQTLTWHWLFLINVPIGVGIAAVVFTRVFVDEPEAGAWRRIDVVAFGALSLGLAALQILMKVAPPDRWASARDAVLVLLAAGGLTVFVRRCLRVRDPLLDLAPLRERAFAVACVYNFVLGVAFFASLYLLPVFLGFVRFHTALEIGVTMAVAGVAQLVSAPFATLAERRLPAPLVVAAGFGLFALGCAWNAFERPTTDFAGLLVPQVLRGAAVLFCIVPITNTALEHLPFESLSNASGLLNAMRNVGGAVGIGFVDTILTVQPRSTAEHLFAALRSGDPATASFVGLPRAMFAGSDLAHADAADVAFVTPIVGRAAVTIACNEAWMVMAGIVALSVLLAPLLARARSAPQREPGTMES
jgi:DHA2 family multidrug resistance protein